MCCQYLQVYKVIYVDGGDLIRMGNYYSDELVDGYLMDDTLHGSYYMDHIYTKLLD